MTFPDQLTIGAHTYSLVFEPCWEGSDNELAHTDYETQTIRIGSTLSDTQKFCTLIHEAMHVMNHEMEHSLLDSLSEQIGFFLLENGLVDEG